MNSFDMTTTVDSHDTAPPMSLWARTRGGLRTLAWVLAAATAATMASERVYWYWGGIDADSVSVLTGFYAVAAAAALFALGRARGATHRHLVLSGALFALVVEAVLTAVIYEDGPLPVLFLMFVGWHGLIAWVGFVFLIRRWALAGRAKVMASAASAMGVLWGLWALSSGINDSGTAQEIAADGGSAEILAPGDFAVYGGWVTAVLIAAHLVLDLAWPKVGWRPSRLGVTAMVVVGLFMFSTLALPAVLWAPVKLVALAAGLRWLARRLPARGSADITLPSNPTPSSTTTEMPGTAIDALAGRIRRRTLLALLPMPAVASGVYAALWPVRDVGALNALWWSLIWAQVVAGLAALVWVARVRR